MLILIYLYTYIPILYIPYMYVCIYIYNTYLYMQDTLKVRSSTYPDLVLSTWSKLSKLIKLIWIMLLVYKFYIFKRNINKNLVAVKFLITLKKLALLSINIFIMYFLLIGTNINKYKELFSYFTIYLLVISYLN